jgi:hypothetical protein
MGGIIGQFGKSLSLRNDPRRLSLESVLSGTALGLALLYLMQDVAEAAGGALGPRAGAGPDAGVGGAEATGSNPGAFGDEQMSAGRGREDPSGLGDAPAAAGGGVPGEAGLPSGSGPGRWQPLEAAAGATRTPSAESMELPVAGPRSLAAGCCSLAAGSSPLAWPGIVRTGFPQSIPAEQPEAFHTGAPEPEIPTFRVILRSSQGIVSRSVEGVARSDSSHSLGTITDALIDLRQTPMPRVIVSSEQDLHLLSLSVLNDAELALDTRHTGLNRASLLLGPEANAIQLRFSDTLDLGLMAGGTARGQIRQSLIGLQDSRLEDAGGDASLQLSSLTGFQLKGPEAQQLGQVNIDLLAEAMRGSTILLGAGNDRVTIASGFRNLEGTGPGLLIDIPGGAQAPQDPSLAVRARALGLVDSLLDTGGGNDQVSIATWLEEPSAASDSSDSERIALLDSGVLLGDGDDQLSVEGDVLASRIDLGDGVNGLRVSGVMRDAIVLADAGSSNAIQLGDGGNSLTIGLTGDGEAEMHLSTGAGDDRIQLPMGELSGSLDGGAGVDSLTNDAMGGPADGMRAASPGEESLEPEPLAITLSGDGEGRIAGLEFTGIENLALGAGQAEVSVGTQGRLEGVLAVGSGEGRLDYSAWQEAVQVDLSQGTASGILGGISGFEEVRGGAGDDLLVAGDGTRLLAGGEGDDRLELDLATFLTAGDGSTPPPVLVGGQGHDQFVIAGVEAIQTMRSPSGRALPVLADLALSPEIGGIGLTDRLALRLTGIPAAGEPQEPLIDLIPSGVDGIGQPLLLPIAPLDELVAGIGERTAGFGQLAIATGDTGSQLVMLSSGGTVTGIAELPALHTISALVDRGTVASGAAGLAA